jgi:hypothetical protein
VEQDLADVLFSSKGAVAKLFWHSVFTALQDLQALIALQREGEIMILAARRGILVTQALRDIRVVAAGHGQVGWGRFCWKFV